MLVYWVKLTCMEVVLKPLTLPSPELTCTTVVPKASHFPFSTEFTRPIGAKRPLSPCCTGSPLAENRLSKSVEALLADLKDFLGGVLVYLVKLTCMEVVQKPLTFPSPELTCITVVPKASHVPFSTEFTRPVGAKRPLSPYLLY